MEVLAKEREKEWRMLQAISSLMKFSERWIMVEKGPSQRCLP